MKQGCALRNKGLHEVKVTLTRVCMRNEKASNGGRNKEKGNHERGTIAHLQMKLPRAQLCFSSIVFLLCLRFFCACVSFKFMFPERVVRVACVAKV